MENASKALIIAGAILLAILIIGLGIFVFSGAKEAMTDTGIDKQKIATYNAPFEAYVGNNVNGAKVRSLYDEVRTHNNAQEDDTKKITIDGKNKPTEINTAKSNIKTGHTYEVKVIYDEHTGYVTSITTKDNTKT